MDQTLEAEKQEVLSSDLLSLFDLAGAAKDFVYETDNYRMHVLTESVVGAGTRFSVKCYTREKYDKVNDDADDNAKGIFLCLQNMKSNDLGEFINMIMQLYVFNNFIVSDPEARLVADIAESVESIKATQAAITTAMETEKNKSTTAVVAKTSPAAAK